MNRPMKTLLALSLFLPAVLATRAHGAVLWSQNFNAGGAFSTYVDATQVTNNKFRTAQTYSSMNTANFDFRMTSPSTAMVNTYGLDFGTSAGYFQYDFNLLSATVLGQISPIGIGSYSGAATNWLSASMQITNTSTLTWNIRDTMHGVNSAQSFTGNQKVTYVINNSGSPLVYDLGSGISGTLANDFLRIYVGSTLLTFGGNGNVAAGAPASSIEGFRLSAGNPAAGVAAFDNIVFATIPVPEANAVLLLGAAGALALVVRRARHQKSKTLA